MCRMRTRLLARFRRQQPAPHPGVDTARLLRIYWETHENVRDLLRETRRKAA